ncbi:hypothetical protein M3Y94_00041500 [Aphelenchoides besseyi]|nr:hypothetical protein M3Y94_00041500 [Aphelenchoides besseyi]
MWDNKTFLFSLDTESLEWKKMITVNGYVDKLISDRTRTLMARARTNSQDPSIVQYCRFVMDGPEKLSTLAWFQLKTCSRLILRYTNLFSANCQQTSN